MADWTAIVTRLRTTSGGSGPAEGIVTGMGATPEEALSGLWEPAKRLAREAVQQVATAAAAAQRAKGRRYIPSATMAPVAGSKEISVPQVGATRQATTPPGVTPAQIAIEIRQDWQFEVIDVRVAPARLDGGDPGWLAYGTLVWDLPGTRGAAAPQPRR